MSTDAPLTVEAIARKPLVGIDTDGQSHHFDRYRDRVYVLDDAGETTTHVENLDPGQLPTWVEYVADERGWTDCRYRDGRPFETLVADLVVAVEGSVR